MLIVIGKQYLTRCKLTVSIESKEEDHRDTYPMLGRFQNGEKMGKTNFWMEDGRFLAASPDDHPMDLVSEA